MLDVKRLILLRDLAEYGTVTAVADIHRVTPSAVSQQLRALEDEAGAALLHREGRTVRLTAAGTALAAQSDHVLAALELAQSAVRALDEQISGELLIGCFPSGLQPLAAPLAAALVRAHPRLRPRIIEAEPEQSLRLLRRRELDLALGYHYRHLGTPLPPGLNADALFSDPLVLAVPENLRVQAEQDGLAALSRHPWIGTPEPSACRDVMMHACHSAGFSPLIEHSYHDLRSALALVAAGLGATILPAMLCENPPTGTAILPLPGRERTVEAVTRAGTGDHPAIAAALAVLRSTNDGGRTV
ncbi:LysR family transcriptional regulator [Actinomadura darangshiensis]|uniref:LysR family transcriptional regulator n=1 Tax=Actinomadura darangshiensis TaxID=705336 RepID=A0A4R5BA78_9ACTN|nr:LysR family transcriptional regulator [Actinomadura darangshiensis]TDD80322.1 LysR family transcriptional regulator [Actinomadura darangshiensis]